MDVICNICSYDLVSEGQDIVSIPCGHVFHRDCLVTWLNIGQRCPHCATPTTARNVSNSLFISSSNFVPQNQSLQDLEKTVKRLHRELESKEQTIRETKLANKYLLHQADAVSRQESAQVASRETLKTLRLKNNHLKGRVDKLNATEKTNAALTKKVTTLQSELNKSIGESKKFKAKYQKYKHKTTQLEQQLQGVLRSCDSELFVRSKNRKK